MLQIEAGGNKRGRQCYLEPSAGNAGLMEMQMQTLDELGNVAPQGDHRESFF
jgi:hypothetical protein